MDAPVRRRLTSLGSCRGSSSKAVGRAPSIAVAAALLLFSAPALAEAEGELSGSLAPGVDTNPRRIVGEEPSPDFLLSLTGNARGRVSFGPRSVAAARYDLGLKKFLEQRGEDVAVQQLDLDVAARFGAWSLGANGAGKLRLSREGERDYGDLSGEGFVSLGLSRTASARAALGARWFSYPPDPDYGSLGPRASLGLRWALLRSLGLSFGLVGGLADFRGNARLESGETGGTRRRDRLLAGQLQLSFRGPVAIQGGYQWSGNWSNSMGESSQRHRISAALTAALPWSCFGSLHGAWQRIHYPDGLFLSKELLDMLLYDDEAQSSLAAKLARPLGRRVELEIKYALYWIELPPRGDEETLTYTRQMASVGAAFRW